MLNVGLQAGGQAGGEYFRKSFLSLSLIHFLFTDLVYFKINGE
jgi:hypothetical protein